MVIERLEQNLDNVVEIEIIKQKIQNFSKKTNRKEIESDDEDDRPRAINLRKEQRKCKVHAVVHTGGIECPREIEMEQNTGKNYKFKQMKEINFEDITQFSFGGISSRF